jgi:hypothetical protein
VLVVPNPQKSSPPPQVFIRSPINASLGFVSLILARRPGNLSVLTVDSKALLIFLLQLKEE